MKRYLEYRGSDWMKYETRIKKSIDRLSEEQLLHELLKVRGVDNPSELLNLTEEVIHDPNLLVDMDYGLEMLKHYLDMQEPHIHIFFD